MTVPDPALAGCKLMIATPIYEGAQGSYVRSAIDLATEAPKRGLSVRFEFILYQPSIVRARNMLTGIFLASDCTHMLFIDADIQFNVDDIVSMVKSMDARAECGVLGAAYPRRMMNWHNVARAVEAGIGRENPADLARFGGEFALHFLHPNQNFSLTELVELSRLGTAMMLIRRAVLEGMRGAYPDLAFRPDPAERQGYRVGEEVHAFFYPMIEPDSRALLSDDYAFCHRVRDAGYRIWLAPWVRTTHSGPAVFRGSFADLAPLYAAPAGGAA